MDKAEVAVLWDSEVEWDRDKPFGKDFMNSSYRVFSELAEQRDASVVIGKFSWYNDGKIERGFCYRNEEWEKITEVEIDGIFDKFKFDDETVELKKKMNSDLEVLNDFRLEEICKDKLLTYEEFPDIVPETRKADESNVKEMLDKYGKAVLKPRYDFGGKGVKVIDDLDDYEAEEDLLVQRFIDSSSGINKLDIDGVHDLRIIIVNGESCTSFVRTPDNGLISNVSRGGTMHHFELEEIPETSFEIVREVEERFGDLGKRVYAVDIIFDEEDTPWILEMNSKPGLVFYNDEDIRSWKEPLMEKVVDTLVEIR
jgi:glutathione synthase/RimK-type ligase-like ATP-grasp enzyme